MKKAVDNFLVIENTPLNPSTHLIRLKSPRPLPLISPGQFVNVEIRNAPGVFLRRPFSIFEVTYQNHSLSLIVKILGKGSYQLTQCQAGDSFSLVYPLGKGFTLPGKNDKILLIGGGSGLAPLLFLARETGLPHDRIDIVIGAKTIQDHVDVDDYRQFGNIHFTTEDGSLGTKGLVTQHPAISVGLGRYDRIYTCGPLPMMKAVGKLARNEKVWCEASLENLMACGFGVCLCCIEPTEKGNKCVCTDGPVFNIDELKWQI